MHAFCATGQFVADGRLSDKAQHPPTEYEANAQREGKQKKGRDAILVVNTQRPSEEAEESVAMTAIVTTIKFGT
jgi:hypothetical protein